MDADAGREAASMRACVRLWAVGFLYLVCCSWHLPQLWSWKKFLRKEDQLTSQRLREGCWGLHGKMRWDDFSHSPLCLLVLNSLFRRHVCVHPSHPPIFLLPTVSCMSSLEEQVQFPWIGASSILTQGCVSGFDSCEIWECAAQSPGNSSSWGQDGKGRSFASVQRRPEGITNEDVLALQWCLLNSKACWVFMLVYGRLQPLETSRGC